MKILVVGTNEACPATFALRSELLPYEFVHVVDEFTYGQTLSRYWAEGETFINIEHDVVPWFGAVKALYQCPYGFCTYQYPIGHSGKLQTALGIIKFSENVMDDFPTANYGWDKTSWNHLDAQVYGALQLDRGLKPDIHEPACAHLKPFEVTPAMDLAQIAARCR